MQASPPRASLNVYSHGNTVKAGAGSGQRLWWSLPCRSDFRLACRTLGSRRYRRQTAPAALPGTQCQSVPATSRALVEHHSGLLQSIAGALRKRRRDGDTNVTPLIATSLSNFAGILSTHGRQEEALNAAEVVSSRQQLASAKPDAFLQDLATSSHTLAKATLSEAISIRRRHP